jgi:hypothetical protein
MDQLVFEAEAKIANLINSQNYDEAIHIIDGFLEIEPIRKFLAPEILKKFETTRKRLMEEVAETTAIAPIQSVMRRRQIARTPDDIDASKINKPSNKPAQNVSTYAKFAKSATPAPPLPGVQARAQNVVTAINTAAAGGNPAGFVPLKLANTITDTLLVSNLVEDFVVKLKSQLNEIEDKINPFLKTLLINPTFAELYDDFLNSTVLIIDDNKFLRNMMRHSRRNPPVITPKEESDIKDLLQQYRTTFKKLKDSRYRLFSKFNTRTASYLYDGANGCAFYNMPLMCDDPNVEVPDNYVTKLVNYHEYIKEVSANKLLGNADPDFKYFIWGQKVCRHLIDKNHNASFQIIKNKCRKTNSVINAVSGRENPELYLLVMPFGGSDIDRMGRDMPAKPIPGLIRSAFASLETILEGFVILKRLNLVHRDVKPGNLTTNLKTMPVQTRIIDFGMMEKFNSSTINIWHPNMYTYSFESRFVNSNYKNRVITKPEMERELTAFFKRLQGADGWFKGVNFSRWFSVSSNKLRSGIVDNYWNFYQSFIRDKDNMARRIAFSNDLYGAAISMLVYFFNLTRGKYIYQNNGTFLSSKVDNPLFIQAVTAFFDLMYNKILNTDPAMTVPVEDALSFFRSSVKPKILMIPDIF